MGNLFGTKKEKEYIIPEGWELPPRLDFEQWYFQLQEFTMKTKYLELNSQQVSLLFFVCLFLL